MHYVCRQLQWSLLMTPTDFDILLATLFTSTLNARSSSSVTPRNLTVETFVRIDSRIWMSNAFYWLEIIIYEVLLTFREILFVFSQFSIHISSWFTVTWTLLMSRRMQKLLYRQQNEQNASGLRVYACHWYIIEKVLGPTPILVEHLM